MSGGGGDAMAGRWRLVGGRRKGPSVAAALSFRRRAALQETSASRIRSEREGDKSDEKETMSGGGGDEMDGRWAAWGFCGRRKGPSVAAALSFRRCAALQETSASRIRPAETETDVVPWRCSHID